MNKIELITKNNAARLDELADQLADTYIYDFARPPWNEVSRCPRCGAFSAASVGSQCAACNVDQIPAYDAGGLLNEWRSLLDDDALIEVLRDNDGAPLRTTISGPLTPAELFARKYRDVPEMRAWLEETLPPEVAYIYDTFANLEMRQRGNLSDRGATLGRIASVFSGLPIVTRTLQPAVVRATVRDAGDRADVYIGKCEAGLAQSLGARAVSTVPDRRTLLFVELGV